jgi:hypothetical protein
MSLGAQISFASKSSTTSFQPCAMANPCFSLSILVSTCSLGKANRCYLLCFSSLHITEQGCASGDSHQLLLAIAVALGLGFISDDILFATNTFVCASSSFSDSLSVD